MPVLPSPTARTLAFAAGGAALLLLGMALGNQDTVWPAVFLIALPLVALLATLAFRPRIAVERTLAPASVPAGEPVAVRVRSTAQRASGVGTVVAEDDPGIALGPPRQAPVNAAVAGAVTEAAYEIRPRRRGRYTLDGYRFRFVDLFGFWLWTLHVAHPTDLAVTPAVVPLPAARASTYGIAGETPIPHTAIAGPDDAMVREYQPRDDVRRIHWPSTAHTGTLMVRREEAAWDPTAWVLLDSRADAHPGEGGEHPGFELLVSATASIGLRLLADGFTVTLADAEGVRREVVPEHTDAEAAWLDPLVDVDVTGAAGLEGATVALTQAGPEHVVIALLGRLDAGDAASLVAAGAPRQRRIAFVLTPDAAARPAFEEGSAMLSGHGWDVRELPALAVLPHAWAPEHAGAR